jgi:hypothetical protein
MVAKIPKSFIKKLKNTKKYRGGGEDNLDKRIIIYNIINDLLISLNLVSENDCLELENSIYKLKNILILAQQIGSQSLSGAIYKTTINDTVINIAAKVMKANDSNKLETLLMLAITDEIILTKKSKHFVIIYWYSYCEKLEIINTKYALVNFNELADNDLQFLLQQQHILEDNELLYNLLIQAFISIGTFHNLTGYIHNDCHWGNFLYIDNTDKEEDTICYYQYLLDDKFYYLKYCKYNVMIYDLALSTDVNMEKYDEKRVVAYNNKIIDDYMRIIRPFINSKHSENILPFFNTNFENLPSDEFSMLIRNNIYDKLEKLEEITPIYTDKDTLLKDIFVTILNICLEQFKDKNIFTDKLPTGCTILNEKPYILYDKIKINI